MKYRNDPQGGINMLRCIIMICTCIIVFRGQHKIPLNSQLLEETDQHRVETYGFPLPVQISEVLTNSSGKFISLWSTAM